MFLLASLLLYSVSRRRETIFATEHRNFILGHRGVRRSHLENTLEAFAAAFTLGLDGVEFDVQMSRDGVPMVFHDRSLERLGHLSKNIDECTKTELTSLALTSPTYVQTYAMPTLSQVLAICPKGKLINVELKETCLNHGLSSIEAIMEVIKPYEHDLNIVISSFDDRILQAVHQVSNHSTLGLLVDRGATVMDILRMRAVFPLITYLNPHINLVTRPALRIFLPLGARFMVWGHKKMGDEAHLKDYTFGAIISDVSESLV